MANLNWFLYRGLRFVKSKIGNDFKKSYSQCGEDLIVRYIFDILKIASPSYLDIGAHHPTYLNNTYLFYQTGSKGVNVEPDPNLFLKINQERPRDVNLNTGVADKNATLDFYIMSSPTLNTFSKQDALKSESSKVKIVDTVKIPVMPVNDILERYFGVVILDYLTLDVEGFDFMILNSFDFSKRKPKVICVETITYSPGKSGIKLNEINELLLKNGYFVYADTHINTIFVDTGVW